MLGFNLLQLRSTWCHFPSTSFVFSIRLPPAKRTAYADLRPQVKNHFDLYNDNRRQKFHRYDWFQTGSTTT